MHDKPKIVKYSHGFTVDTTRKQIRAAVIQYAVARLAEWEYVKPHPRAKAKKQIKKIYAAATASRNEFRFHISLFDDIMRVLDRVGYGKSKFDIIEKPAPTPVEVDLPLKEGFSPRDEQKGVINFFSNPDKPNKVTDLQTGLGKTACTLFALSNLGMRAAIQIRGGFVSRWLEGIHEVLDLDKEDIVVVRGRNNLISIINSAKEGSLSCKIIIITWKTMYAFFKEYEKNPVENMYGISPEDLYEVLGIGVKVVDEVHLDYHHNFRDDVYTNIKTAINLSATLNTEDSFRQEMYDIALPKNDWFNDVAYKSYIGTYAMYYGTTSENYDKIRTTEYGDDRYSHGAYEKSIMRNRDMLQTYLEVIRAPVDQFYITDDWVSGQKAIIFCKLTDFCDIVTEHLRDYYQELSINTYISYTPESVLETSDIIVTTIESCGVAVDISGLRLAVLTRAVRKLEANEQIKGRLRQLKDWPDVTPIFAYLVNKDISKHMDYDRAKREQFRGKVVYLKSQRIPLDL